MQIVTTTRKGQFGIAGECGQPVWRPSSWRYWSREQHRYVHNFRFRRLTGVHKGFAFGPIMVWKN